MVDITIRIDEDKLKELLHDIFDSISIGDSMDYSILYKKYIDKLVDSCSATFFYGPTNLEEWIKDTINGLMIITPSHSDYDRIYKCWQEQKYDIGNGYYIAEEYNGCILVEYYT